MIYEAPLQHGVFRLKGKPPISHQSGQQDMTREELLAEAEDLLRNMPDRGKISHHLDENYSWLGRVAAVLEAWNRVKGRYIQLSIAKIHGTDGWKMDEGINDNSHIVASSSTQSTDADCWPDQCRC